MAGHAAASVVVLGPDGAKVQPIVAALRALGRTFSVVTQADIASLHRLPKQSKIVLVVSSPLGEAKASWRDALLSALRGTAGRERLLLPDVVTKESAEAQLERLEAFVGGTLDESSGREALRQWTRGRPVTVREVRASSAVADAVLYAALMSSAGVTVDFEDDDLYAIASFDEQLRSEVMQARLEAERAQMANERAIGDLHALTSSHAWKTTAPLRIARRVLGAGVRAVRRSQLAFSLEPSANAQSSGDDSRWVSDSGDPEFLLSSSDGRLPSGWTVIDMRFEDRTTGGTDLRLMADYGEGFSVNDAVRLPAPVDGRVTQVVELKRGLQRLRLDLAGATGEFALHDVTFTEITSAEAGARLSARFARSRRWTKRDATRLARKAINVWRSEGLTRVFQLARGDERFVIDARNYADWIERFERLGKGDVTRIKQRIQEMQAPPIISVILPVYNTPVEWLRKAIDSVRGQIYPHWELCIADDASTNVQTTELLREYEKADERIKIVFRKENGHISRASNSALERATGTFVALLDHDDELAAHALYMVAETISTHPNAGIIYSDEDKIDEDGNRYDPHFKPDWNPELFLGQNFVSHLGVYRRTLVNEVGGFRPGFEGSQDYDLALRVSEKVAGDQIIHIPWVLYHWRSIPGSTALAADEKNYALEAAGRALAEHVKRTGLKAAVEKHPSGLPYHRVKHNGARPRVAIIMPTKDRVDLLSRAIDSIREKTDYPSYEIIVVDNRSELEETRTYFKTLERSGVARVLTYDHPFNYSALNNFAVKHTDAPLVALLNNDVEVIAPAWLSEMVAHAVRPEIGCVGAMLYYPDDRVQHAGVILGINGVAGHTHRLLKRGSPGYFSRASLTQAMSVVTAACLVVRRSVYEEVGGLDESLKVAFNDVDFCLRVRAKGYRNVWTPHAELYHYESATRGPDTDPKHRARFASETAFMKARWGSLLTTDPAYNPNLSLVTLNFGIAQPPRAPKPWHAKHDNA